MAVVERKTLADLVSSLLSGRLRFLVGELDTLPRAAVVVEDRYSQGFRLDRVRPAAVRMDLGYEDLFTLTAPAAPEPNTAEVRAWTRTAGLAVPDRADCGRRSGRRGVRRTRTDQRARPFRGRVHLRRNAARRIACRLVGRPARHRQRGPADS